MTKAAKQAHRRLAYFIGLFLVVHFSAHLAAPFGLTAQDTAMQTGRTIYQFWLFEGLLVMALVVQIALGVTLLRGIRRRKRKDIWHKIQFISAAYMAMFIVMHTAAALTTRLYIGLDSNFYWAAATVILSPLKYGFAPYYFLAVTALFSHIAAALHFRGPRQWHGPALAIGPIVGVTIVMAYAGAFYDITLPQAYIENFSAFPGR